MTQRNATTAPRKRRQILLLLALSGAAMSIPLIWPTLGWLQYFALIPTAMLLYGWTSDRTVRLRRLYGYGFWGFFWYGVVLFHWFIAMYPLDFAGLSPFPAAIVVFLGCVGMGFFQATMAGLVFVVFGWIARLPWFSENAKRSLCFPFLAAACWIILEWSQTIGWVGVPWGRLCLGQRAYLPILQSASLLGSYFVDFLLVAINFLLAQVLLWAQTHDWKNPRTLVRQTSLWVACGLFLVNLGYGFLSFLPVMQKETDTVRVAVIQGNFSSQEKWGAGYKETFARYASYSRAAAEQGAEIILWPESAIPYYILSESRESYRQQIQDLANECGATLLVGTFEEEERDGHEYFYNVIADFQQDGSLSETVYRKVHLVPFGEYVPWHDAIMTLIPPLASISMLEDDLDAGDEMYVFTLPQGTVGALICFDSIYESLARDSVRNGAQILCLGTNDSWFLDSAAIYEHLGQAQLRAIENGRWIARAANTGVSAFLSSRGEIAQELPPMVEGYLIQDVPLHTQQTLYTRIGNLFVCLCLTGVSVGLVCAVRDYVRKRRARAGCE